MAFPSYPISSRFLVTDVVTPIPFHNDEVRLPSKPSGMHPESGCARVVWHVVPCSKKFAWTMTCSCFFLNQCCILYLWMQNWTVKSPWIASTWRLLYPLYVTSSVCFLFSHCGGSECWIWRIIWNIVFMHTYFNNSDLVSMLWIIQLLPVGCFVTFFFVWIV